MSPDNVCHVPHAAVADFCVAAVEDLVEFAFLPLMDFGSLIIAWGWFDWALIYCGGFSGFL